MRAARVGWTLAALALSCVPYLLEAWRAPAGWTYLWVVPPYPEDGLAYLAWTKQAELGEWLFRVKYTPLPQGGLIFNPFFLAAGPLARLVGAGPALFLLRLAGIVAFFAALERLLERLGLDEKVRRNALALAALSSGIGWMFSRGTDLTLVDSNTLWSLSWSPILPWSFSAMLFSLESALRGRWLAAGALVSALALIHPYDVVIMSVLLGALWLDSGRRPADLARLALGAAPGPLYQLWLSHVEPVLAMHATLGRMVSPTPLNRLLGMGALAPLAALGAWRLGKKAWPLTLWVAASWVLAYAPLWFKLKLITGSHIPLCILAAAALPPRRLALALLLGLPSHARNAWRHDDKVYLEPDKRETLNALKSAAAPEDLVLASSKVSRYIPAWSGQTVMFGHWAQSVDRHQRRQWLSKARSADELRAAGVRWVIEDEDLAPLKLPLPKTPVFRRGEYALYRL